MMSTVPGHIPRPGRKEPLFAALFCALFIFASITAAGQESSLSLRPVGGGYYQLTFLTLEDSIPDAGILLIEMDDNPAVFGELEITCDSVSVVRVDAQLAYKADDRGDAEEIEDLIQLFFEPGEKDLSLSLVIDNELRSAFKKNRPRADIQITVPVGTRVEIDAPYLQLTSTGPVGGLTVRESYQPVEISGADGHLNISAVNTRVSVENLTGSFEISNSNGKIILTDITVTDLRSSALRSASARTENNDISLTRYTGPMNFHVTRGTIRGRSVTLTGRKSTLRNSGGVIDIRFDDVAHSARLQVRNSFEDVRLRFKEDISATFSLTAREDGTIDLRNIPHRVDKVTEQKFEAIAGEGLAQVRVTTRHGGDIFITGHR